MVAIKGVAILFSEPSKKWTMTILVSHTNRAAQDKKHINSTSLQFVHKINFVVVVVVALAVVLSKKFHSEPNQMPQYNENVLQHNLPIFFPVDISLFELTTINVTIKSYRIRSSGWTTAPKKLCNHDLIENILILIF